LEQFEVEMLPALVLVLVYSLSSFPQQNDVWQNVLDYAPKPFKIYTPSSAQLARVRKVLSMRARLDNWPCAEGDDPGWTENLKFEQLPVSATEEIVLVEAGPGCARGGQGSNGAMWIIRFQGDKCSLLAIPQRKFNGWLYSVQQTTSHGFRDIVFGWHMSATEIDLSYFRFDGTSYQRVGAATHLTDADGYQRIIPKPLAKSLEFARSSPAS
jgi:hypothetical protein